MKELLQALTLTDESLSLHSAFATGIDIPDQMYRTLVEESAVIEKRAGEMRRIASDMKADWDRGVAADSRKRGKMGGEFKALVYATYTKMDGLVRIVDQW